MFQSAADVYTYLSSFINLERKLEPIEYRLDRMHYLRKLFGYPDEAVRTIHVTGSKGKGSTATLLASILTASGYKTGLFTSPHVLNFTERIAINKLPVTNDILLPCAEEIYHRIPPGKPLPVPEFEYPTFFELLTILAFLCYKRAGCQYAVIEVGLGGRLDTTNVICPELAIITSIELEHTEILGSTVDKIAYEKAGIIKSLIPVISAVSDPVARSVIYTKAYNSVSPFYNLDSIVSEYHTSETPEGISVTWRDSVGNHTAQSSLHGIVQSRNIMTAWYAGNLLQISPDAILQGIRSTTMRARFEIIPGEPTIILDGAHTEVSILNTVETYQKLFPEPCVLLFGTAQDKHSFAMLKTLYPITELAVITRPGTFKQSEPERILEEAHALNMQAELIADTEAAVIHAHALAKARKLPLLICGSFYLCADALKTLA
ncbi:MAG TPA: Mur ligase family protein [Spirochaetia bacterium]|nr:Mur ligase family protein [Spirochaetales bacterium]HPD80447.1 Mur ligase family protein [Spirochaetales bacterium]HRS65527.1 Mur ligase family protein [Spirochaetia bacterium]